MLTSCGRRRLERAPHEKEVDGLSKQKLYVFETRRSATTVHDQKGESEHGRRMVVNSAHVKSFPAGE